MMQIIRDFDINDSQGTGNHTHPNETSEQDYEANQDFYDEVDDQEQENDQNYSDNEQDTHDHLAFD